MGYYFPDHLSMHAATGSQVQATLNAIVKRYVGTNPPLPMTYRAYSRRGILRGKDYRYRADFSQIFPHARDEQYVYAWAKYWSDAPATFLADVSCFGPMVVHVNGQVIFQSDIFTERYPDRRHRIQLPLTAGWNHCVMRFQKTRAGFGGIFGTWLGKHPYYFLMPTPERAGGGGQQEGWIFTQPMDAQLPALPGPDTSEASSGIKWLPQRHCSVADAKKGQFERLFPSRPGTCAVAWTSAQFPLADNGKYRLQGNNSGPISITINDKEVYHSEKSGKFDAAIAVPRGCHAIMVKSTCTKKSGWGFYLAITAVSAPLPFSSPCAIVGTNDPWIYIGPFAADSKVSLKDLRNLDKVHPTIDGDIYWRVDMPAGHLRPYNDNKLYAHWNYPLGVTLYGLLHSAKIIGSEETNQYIINHMQSCCATLNYALWDKDQYGGATALHTLLSSIDSLDDCGSFASTMLEVNAHSPIQGTREIADYVADYISHKQARLDDGTFFRQHLMHTFHENTLWADDLYMSVPFLCRYAALTGDSKYLDDAAQQFLGFKQRLFIPQLKLMSHVFDFNRNMATGIPWGRGNGWTLFSLTELLAVLPQNHHNRPQLLTFFRELCAGLLPLQDDTGMWHQVLTHPDAYPETSCTAMFACAFARAVQSGWLQNPAPYAHSALNAWTALNQISIDRHANIHGVCRGSEFSFSPDYYKQALLPNLNDTHGIGIVLLAGVEVLRMMSHLQREHGSRAKHPEKAVGRSLCS